MFLDKPKNLLWRMIFPYSFPKGTSTFKLTFRPILNTPARPVADSADAAVDGLVNVEAIFVDHEISPSQARHLEVETGGSSKQVGCVSSRNTPSRLLTGARMAAIPFSAPTS